MIIIATMMTMAHNACNIYKGCHGQNCGNGHKGCNTNYCPDESNGYNGFDDNNECDGFIIYDVLAIIPVINMVMTTIAITAKKAVMAVMDVMV